MAIELFVLMLLKAQLAVTAAVLLVLALRLPVRRALGAELSYGLWVLVPTAALASLFPTLGDLRRTFSLPPDGLVIYTLQIPVARHAAAIGAVWLAGAVAAAALFALGHWRFARRAAAGQAGPAVTGAWARMVVPGDYAQRFTPEERRLIRAHERAHMDRQDLKAGLLIAFFQTAGWCNPLVHLAAGCARLDLELACDARVMAGRRGGRRLYAETLLKAHARGWSSPLACALAVGGRHPLEVRLAALGMRRVSVRRDRLGVFAIGLLAASLAVALWALTPVWWELLGSDVVRRSLRP